MERAVWGQIGVDDGGSLQVEAQPSYSKLVEEKTYFFNLTLVGLCGEHKMKEHNQFRPTCGEKTGAEMPSTALGPCLPGASCAGAAAEGAGNSSSTEAC